MLDYLNVIQTESDRFAHITASTDRMAQIPSCPGWSVSDLVWHLAEVQYFWGSIVAGLLESPDSVAELPRPHDDGLDSLFATHSSRLIEALRDRQPHDKCWSWYEKGQTVGWVLRRQAHEALIHRVDAELAGGAVSAIDEDLATDGIDEILANMLDCRLIPDWSHFEPDGNTAAIVAPQRRWEMSLGRFSGTSPESGIVYDDPALLLRSGNDAPAVIISGSAADIDLWLWGRGDINSLRIEGDPVLADVIRATAAAGTQ